MPSEELPVEHGEQEAKYLMAGTGGPWAWRGSLLAGDLRPAATEAYEPQPAQSSALLQIPTDLSIIESDESTKACMADMACMREIFVK